MHLGTRPATGLLSNTLSTKPLARCPGPRHVRRSARGAQDEPLCRVRRHWCTMWMPLTGQPLLALHTRAGRRGSRLKRGERGRIRGVAHGEGARAHARVARGGQATVVLLSAHNCAAQEACEVIAEASGEGHRAVVLKASSSILITIAK